METRGALFREIHKNTWLKRLTAEGRKFLVGSKKSEKSWVVFCVHNDIEALLEGYAEPRQAASHNPEWVISLQNTQHISHSLVPNEQEYEFVITLNDEIIRFHAFSWEIMQEWVSTLRSKLREIKILSPKENLYTKLPEPRAPLLPTRDPTSPLPATPPVPAAIVPGVERIIPSNSAIVASSPNIGVSTSSSFSLSTTSLQSTQSETIPSTVSPKITVPCDTLNITNSSSISNNSTSTINSVTRAITSTIPSTSMSNTLTQNLLNMLSDPITNYSLQVSEQNGDDDSSSTDSYYGLDAKTDEETRSIGSKFSTVVQGIIENKSANSGPNIQESDNNHNALAINLLQNQPYNVSIASHSSTRLRNFGNTTQDAALNEGPIIIPRPQTSRSTNASDLNSSIGLNISNEEQISNTNVGADNVPDEITTNITIIQVSNSLLRENVSKSPKNIVIENSIDQEQYKSNVQIIPSSLDAVTNVVHNDSENNELDLEASSNIFADLSKITTVHVSGCLDNMSSTTSITSEDDQCKKLILSSTLSGVTSIAVGSEINMVEARPSYYEKVCLTSSSSAPIDSQKGLHNQKDSPLTINLVAKSEKRNKMFAHDKISESSRNAIRSVAVPIPSTSSSAMMLTTTENIHNSPSQLRHPISRENTTPLVNVKPALTRGLTEAVITARPSRIDMKNSKPLLKNRSGFRANADRVRSESLEHRRPSADAAIQSPEPSDGRDNIHQKSVQSFRVPKKNSSIQLSKRLTLREEQVLHLKREICHPGGVRLQLRRKDCLNSIAWVDVFGAVWVSGWKQKDHPMLYNALHIGDQLVSIGQVAISSATEANKIIRTSNSLFIEILIRRVPFGRVYAIRRDREGQCLGLIRDGNTATIVDVVPNSLAARHGLSPRAHSFDGLSLTFWVLTEINGRPLNLFFKENEVRDRLNSVGRDISILVQPLDLVTKIKKQLKSMRSYKDYIVQ